MKNSHNEKIFFLNEKNVYGKNISYWIENYFDWIKICFDIMKKKWCSKKIFHWIQIYCDWIKIYFDIMEKSDIIKIYFIEYKFILIE